MRRRTIWLISIAAALVVLLVAFVRFFIDEPLRQTIERNVNKSLQGYTVRIHALKFHPLGFSLDLIDSTIIQNTYPNPPVAHLPYLHASVHWRALLNGRLVADFLIDQPKLYINLKQAKQEVEDQVAMADRGWQDALEEIYPLKVNFFTVQDAEITYVEKISPAVLFAITSKRRHRSAKLERGRERPDGWRSRSAVLAKQDIC
jgi:uncharacterized protein involved in outer membrane biogenesis